MSLDPERFESISSRIGHAKVMILGDIMLDEYLFGSVNRISPEAPVPVVEIASDRILLGGAANVAANIRALGDEPILVGTVGQDEAASKLSRLLSQHDISSDYCISDDSRRTTIKTRIMAHSQQVVRADREDSNELDSSIETRIYKRFLSVADEIDAVIISDYGKGVVTASLLEKVISVCKEKDIFVGVDPNESRFPNYRKVSLITPNHNEAGFAYGRRISSIADLDEVGHGLLKQLEVKSILITRGADGMSLYQAGVKPTHIPTFARKVYDVTGAGDTVIALFVSAVCAGANLTEGAIVANAGGGLTVAEVGTATVTKLQLSKELQRNIKNWNPETMIIGT
ncbi:MAG: D-glycero-beta-D-manno-heptose-7-phosphate kinase [candidate division Zixibacteria bacterium]|nr:D-glycero-beta-D-manno-heptose-7-phosphate kinase [candidate division Zixibacteria bacterium]